MVNRSGGGGGALPFQDLRWGKAGHFGSYGEIWSVDCESGSPKGARNLSGVVSKQAATVTLHFIDGTTKAAQVIDVGDHRANFFVLVWSPPAEWDRLVARDARGRELETVRAESLRH
jgi:hypothetical protein